MNVTEGMWQMVSDLLNGEKLPVSMNEAIAGLCDGTLKVCPAGQDIAAINDHIKDDERIKLG